MRVLVVDSIAPEGLAYLRERGCEVDEQVADVAGAVEADFARLIRL